MAFDWNNSHVLTRPQNPKFLNFNWATSGLKSYKNPMIRGPTESYLEVRMSYERPKTN